MSGIWQAWLLRMDTKVRHVIMRLNYGLQDVTTLGSKVVKFAIGGAYVITTKQENLTLTSYEICNSTSMLKLAMTKSMICNCLPEG